MSKIKEQHSSERPESAENTEDQEFDKWVRQQFLEEAEDIEKEIEQIPDSNAWEPTEEKFQELLQKAKKQGTIQDPADFIQKRDSEKDRDQKNKNKNRKEKLNKEQCDNTKEKVVKKHSQKPKVFNLREKVIKWAAAAAVTIFGIFGVSMSSEANRAYIMEKVDRMLGNKVETKVNNDETLTRDTTEESAMADIADALNVEMPQFFYWPHGIEYEDYTVDVDAQIGIVQYKYKEDIFYLMVYSNIKDASALAISGLGEKTETITSELSKDIKSSMWRMIDETDEKPTFMLQWSYKNVYYELSGKFAETDMENIANNIMF